MNFFIHLKSHKLLKRIDNVNIIKTSFFVSLVLIMSACGSGMQEKSLPPCNSKESCLKNPDCLCWCSQKCGWRKKTPADHPVYIENDPYGKFCYCKQWDFDHYEDNCINGKNVKQSPGTK
jgi:hypothetical protein